jgi:hypothetical protein
MQRYHTFPRQHRNPDIQAVSAIADIFRKCNYAPVITHLNLNDVVIISGSKASCMSGSPPRSALHREASALRRQETPDLQVSAFYHLHRIEPWMLRRWTNDHRKAAAIDQRPPAIQPKLSGALYPGIMAKQRCSISMSPVQVWTMSLGICRYQCTVIVL